MDEMRVSLSCAVRISRRFCFSSTGTMRWEEIVSASLPGSSTRTAASMAS
jgi:hypothetical protein